jgi:hypothetical protein
VLASIKKSDMKKFIVQTVLFLTFALSYTVSSAQTGAASSCPKKGTAECPMIKDCPKKGTADCPYAASTASLVKLEKADCPLVGTAECPLEKCPLKGTADCPLTKNAMKATYASYTAVAKNDEDNLPSCCKKRN